MPGDCECSGCAMPHTTAQRFPARCLLSRPVVRCGPPAWPNAGGWPENFLVKYSCVRRPASAEPLFPFGKCNVVDMVVLRFSASALIDPGEGKIRHYALQNFSPSLRAHRPFFSRLV